MMYIFQGIVSGLIATIIFDLFNFSLNYIYQDHSLLKTHTYSHSGQPIND